MKKNLLKEATPNCKSENVLIRVFLTSFVIYNMLFLHLHTTVFFQSGENENGKGFTQGQQHPASTYSALKRWIHLVCFLRNPVISYWKLKGTC